MSDYEDDRSIILKTPDEIERMYEANQLVAQILVKLQKVVQEGLSTWDLDKIAEEECQRRKVKAAFKGYRGFPGSVCISVNEQIVHGIPSRKVKLKKGDIVSLDFGVLLKGYYGDSAITVPVATVSSEKKRLMSVTKRSLELGIEQVIIGNRISDVAAAIQNYVEAEKFSIVRQFVGHGIGASLHEAPEVPNYVQGGKSPRLVEGMVIAIEPMVNAGTHEVRVLKDGWTVITRDKRPSAHFEHTVAITKDGPRILSSRENFSAC